MMPALSGLLLVLVIAGADPVGAAAPQQEVNLIPAFERLGLSPLAQGDRPTCSLFAVTALADFEWRRAHPDSRGEFSEEFLLWAVNDASGVPDDQAMFFEAVHGLNARGICPRNLMPYAPTADRTRRPSEEAIRDAAGRSGLWRVHWIRRWDVKRPFSSAQFADLKQAISKNHPVACGLRWPKQVTLASLMDPPDTEGVHDGHSIALVGYRDDPAQPGGGVLRFRNSLGPRWGDHGYGTMSYAYLLAYANDAFWLELSSPESERPVASFEAEEMTVVASENCDAWPQAMKPWKAGLWSGGKQLFCKAEAGGFVELGFGVQKEGEYRVCFLGTAAPDYGRVRVSIDGEPEPLAFDLYSGRVSPAGVQELGSRHLGAGNHRIRIRSDHQGSASRGTFFGIDRVDLLPASRSQ